MKKSLNLLVKAYNQLYSIRKNENNAGLDDVSENIYQAVCRMEDKMMRLEDLIEEETDVE